MPPALHPRSGFTTTLFGATLAVSFLVVGLPHLLPCPAPTRQLAEGSRDGFVVDEKGRPVRRRRRRVVTGAETAVDGGAAAAEEGESDVNQRECPVPKPAGFIGQFMGFKPEEQHKSRKPVEVRIEAAVPTVKSTPRDT